MANKQLIRKKKPVTCGKVWNWTLQIILWILIVFTIIAPILGLPILSYTIGLLVFLVIYWINACCSHSCAYLNHRKSGSTIHDYMGNLFYTPANIDFHMQCYHYETYTTTSTDSEGNTTTTTHTETVVTWSGTESFKYNSWLDVSGPFLLDTTDFVHDAKLAWIKLNLSYKIEFIDEATRLDCERQKDQFVQANKYRDVHYSITQHERIETFYKYNLVSLSENPEESKIKTRYMFLSTLFCCTELYKKYVDSFCIRQNFVIKKLLSSTTNLNIEENSAKYLDKTPKIVIENMFKSYNEPDKMRKSTFVQDLPNQEQVEKINDFYKSLNDTKTPINTGTDIINVENNERVIGMTVSYNAHDKDDFSSNTKEENDKCLYNNKVEQSENSILNITSKINSSNIENNNDINITNDTNNNKIPLIPK